MTKTKTMSVRIEPDLHEEIIEECNIRGCKPNDFLEEAIRHELEGNEPESEPRIFEDLQVEYGKVYDEEGNLIGTIGKNS